ncbi:hypothetical protein [Microbacterium oxydans]|uniref:hypothetical protein n=1 Tax=Microbacterium oxydans TaxID=82380 RepID=UPI001F499201|nr:hypothetical protein [Microbacterium oxydans]
MWDIKGQFSETQRAILGPRSRVQASHFAKAIGHDGKADSAAQSGPHRSFNRGGLGAVEDAEEDGPSTHRLSDLHDGGKSLERFSTCEDERGFVVVRQVGQRVDNLGVHRDGNAGMAELRKAPSKDVCAATVKHEPRIT